MPKKKVSVEQPLFPILRGESIGRPGECIGIVVAIPSAEKLKRKWLKKDIVVLKDDLEAHFQRNGSDMKRLLKQAGAVVTEFGSSVGEWAEAAHATESICVAKVADALHVVEDGMRIRIVAKEGVGEIFFIE